MNSVQDRNRNRQFMSWKMSLPCGSFNLSSMEHMQFSFSAFFDSDQIFDDHLFEVTSRIAFEITDQFFSSNGADLLSNFIFLFLLTQEIR